MKTVFHKANTRKFTDMGWVKAYRSFSFGDYFDPERINFGALRVLNDDVIAPSKGFGKHPHNNMEILTIPLEGAVKHGDSQGNEAIIRAGEIQVMSGGTGIFHTEYNHLDDQEAKLLQIWVYPNKRDVVPRYQQLALDMEQAKNQWLQILSPNPDDSGVWIYQDAWFHLGQLSAEKILEYHPKKEGNGVYVFVIEGDIVVDNQKLTKRDGLGIWEIDKLELQANSDAYILLMDVPMNWK